MRRDGEYEVWDPVDELSAGGLSAKQIQDIQRAEAWSYYLNGGGGDPRYFDFETWIRNRDHIAAIESEREREWGR